MKILVTGSHGFIAKHLIKRLDPIQHEVTLFDTEGERNTFNTEYKFDLIYHLGAKTGARGTDYSEYEYYNVANTLELINSAKKHGTKVIYASSSSAKNPTNFYGLTKKWNEDMFKMLLPDSVGLRLFTVYGPNMRKDMFIYKAIEAIKRGTGISIYYGDKEKYAREFTYIEDVVDILINAQNIKAGVYDVSSGEKTNIIDAVNIIGSILERNVHSVVEKIDDAVYMKSENSIIKNPTPFIFGIKRTLEQWQG